MDAYQQYIHKSRYARYLPEEQRRETWEETVYRYLNYWVDRVELNDFEQSEIFQAIHNLDVMPSMRALMTAGEALDRDNVAGFNCSYLPIDHPKAFDEMMYVLMCGTGVGFSVERQYISKLPEVAEDFHDTDTVIHVADSKIGWAKAYRELIAMLFSGQVPKWDTSGVRPAGAALKTFGGRASGPEPLVDLFAFTVEVFRGAAGRRLSSVECHDLCCKIAQIVVVGGVRRSALISLSNLTDDRLRRCKSGQWWVDNPQRGLANNSACYTEKPDFEAFLNEWKSLYESRSGERGMFSRVASQRQAARNELQEMSDEMLPMILELIHAVRSSSDPTSSVIFRKLLSGKTIVSQTSNEKYVLRLSLGLYKLP
jgi:ribonucleoside-diphosphate reductase alpha chain